MEGIGDNLFLGADEGSPDDLRGGSYISFSETVDCEEHRYTNSLSSPDFDMEALTPTPSSPFFFGSDPELRRISSSRFPAFMGRLEGGFDSEWKEIIDAAARVADTAPGRRDLDSSMTDTSAETSGPAPRGFDLDSEWEEIMDAAARIADAAPGRRDLDSSIMDASAETADAASIRCDFDSQWDEIIVAAARIADAAPGRGVLDSSARIADSVSSRCDFDSQWEEIIDAAARIADASPDRGHLDSEWEEFVDAASPSRSDLDSEWEEIINTAARIADATGGRGRGGGIGGDDDLFGFSEGEIVRVVEEMEDRGDETEGFSNEQPFRSGEDGHEVEGIFRYLAPEVLPVPLDEDEFEFEVLPGSVADAAHGGAPPAARAAVDRLQVVAIGVGDAPPGCAVCKDGIEQGRLATRLPCAHLYHGACIVPWLAIRNSCPVCRYELPTDDPEYERRRSAAAGGSTA